MGVDFRLRSELLADVSRLLVEVYGGSEYERAIVRLVRKDGTLCVASLETEGIFGDEARVDAACAGAEAREGLPILAQAVDTLSRLEGVDAEEAGGGTFVRVGAVDAGMFDYFPTVIRGSSRTFEALRAELHARLASRTQSLREQHHIGTGEPFHIDLPNAHIRFEREGRVVTSASFVPIGSFDAARQRWAWASYQESLPGALRGACAEILDGITERDMWEISTPEFGADEATTWALAALFMERAGGQGVFRVRDEEAWFYLMLKDIRPSLVRASS